MKLDFSYHFKQIQAKYQNTVKAVFTLSNVSIKQRVLLVNSVASALLMYTMNSLIFPEQLLKKLDTWTAKQFKYAMKAPNDPQLDYCTELGLKQLKQLNYTLYINTQVAWTLNQPDALPQCCSARQHKPTCIHPPHSKNITHQQAIEERRPNTCCLCTLQT